MSEANTSRRASASEGPARGLGGAAPGDDGVSEASTSRRASASEEPAMGLGGAAPGDDGVSEANTGTEAIETCTAPAATGRPRRPFPLVPVVGLAGTTVLAGWAVVGPSVQWTKVARLLRRQRRVGHRL